MIEESASRGSQPSEPSPGQWLCAEEFATVVRLTPLVSIDLVVHSQDRRVLVGRRTNEPAKGILFVPGGRITKNETMVKAFERLSREELGVEPRLETARFLGVYEHMYPTNRFGSAAFGTHYVVLAYELDLILNPAGLPTDQHVEYLWLSPPELLSRPDVHENTKAYFRGR
jgi:colanic acid biosynthesis protein WcaH